jgi:hypothetical protein
MNKFIFRTPQQNFVAVLYEECFEYLPQFHVDVNLNECSCIWRCNMVRGAWESTKYVDHTFENLD